MKTRAICLLLLGMWAMPIEAGEFFVAPAGSASGDGSMARPWDLQTALNQPAPVQPGDTLWLRGGVYCISNAWTIYSSRLAGAAKLPIIVRQYPGERATVNGALRQWAGGWTWFWGFEIVNLSTNRTTPETGPFPTNFQVKLNGQLVDMCVAGFDLRAPNCKLINLVIHDCIGSGPCVNTQATNAELYGCLCYYNGWQGGDRGHGHGSYDQNAAPSRDSIRDGFFFANYALGLQITGSGNSPTTDNFDIEGNGFFLNGVLSSKHQQNFLLGPYAGAAQSPLILSNCVFDSNAQGTVSDTYIGYTGGSVNAIVEGNYFQTSTLFNNNTNLTLTGNTFLGGVGQLNPSAYPGNVYLAAAPAHNFVCVRTNRYEPGRAHIMVYNWESAASVALDVSGLLPLGSNFEVRNAQDFFGSPVLSGIYSGGMLSLPMRGLAVAKPAGAAAPASSAPLFSAFVLLPVGNAPPTNSETILLQAESGLVAAPMVVRTNQSSGVISVCATNPAQGSVALAFSVTKPGNFRVWCRFLATNYNSDSIFVSMDAGTMDVFDMAQGSWTSAWQWGVVNGRNGGARLTLNPRTFDLSAGPHKLTFWGREPFAELDQVVITSDPTYAPSGGSLAAIGQSNALALCAWPGSLAPSEMLQGGDTFQAGFPALWGAYYYIESSTNLSQWQTIEAGIVGASGMVWLSQPLPTTEPCRFFRWKPD